MNRAPSITPDPGLHAVHVRPPPRVGVTPPVRRVRQRRHLPRLLEGLPLPELPGLPDPLVPRPRGAPHRVERLHGPRRDVPDARCRSSRSLPIPQGYYDVPLDRQRRHVRHRGPAALRRRRTERRLRGRHPRERSAMAGHEGRAAQVPLPHPQRVRHTVLPLAARQRRASGRRRHGRRPDGGTPAGHEPAARQRRALRGHHRLREVQDGAPRDPAQPQPEEQPRLHPHRQGHGLRRRGQGEHHVEELDPQRPQPEQPHHGG